MRTLRILFFFFLFAPFSSGQVIYVVTGSNQLYRLNMDDCSIEFVVDVQHQTWDISFSPDGTLYGISADGNLFVIDTLTGQTNTIYDFGGQDFNSLTIGADGIIYTIGNEGELWSFDPITGIPNFLGDVGYNATGDLTFYKGGLYVAVTGDRIVRIDLANTSNSIVVIDENIPGNILGIVSDVVNCNEINCYAITNGFSDIYQIDFDAHTLTLVCDLNITVGGGASTSEFLGSSPIILDTIIGIDPNCKNENGSLSIQASGGFGALEFSIDGNPFQDNNVFSNLMSGTYTITIADRIGCKDSADIQLIIADAPVMDTIIVRPTTCGENNGSIIAIASGGNGPITYSLDSITFQAEGLFDSLDHQRFHVIAIDSAGCIVVDNALIDSLGAASIALANISNTTCGEANGAIVISVDVPGDILYSIDGLNFQNNNHFENLNADAYLISIEDTTGCRDTVTVSVAPSEVPQIEVVDNIPATCGASNGSLTVRGIGGVGGYLYSFDGNSFQVSNQFTQLATGSYTIQVMDEDACTNKINTEIEEVAGLKILNLSTSPTLCGNKSGTISIEMQGGTAPVTVSLNNAVAQAESFFEDLGAGNYTIHIVDAAGCSLDTISSISQTGCPVYIPNIFSPNGDGVNDLFQIQTADENEVMITRFFIFDRWGNNVYKRYDLPIHSTEGWWDGTFKKFTMNPGVYAYYIEVEFKNGDRDTFKGDITLIR